MIIELTPEWRIRTDPLNWTLEKRERKKDKHRQGTTAWQWKTAGYYGSLDQCLEAIVCHVGRDLPEVATLRDLVIRCRGIHDSPMNEKLATDLEVTRAQLVVCQDMVWNLLRQNVALTETLDRLKEEDDLWHERILGHLRDLGYDDDAEAMTKS